MNAIRDEKMALYRFPPLHIVAYVVFRGLETRQWTGTPTEKCMIPKRMRQVDTRKCLSGRFLSRPGKQNGPFPGNPCQVDKKAPMCAVWLSTWRGGTLGVGKVVVSNGQGGKTKPPPCPQKCRFGPLVPLCWARRWH